MHSEASSSLIFSLEALRRTSRDCSTYTEGGGRGGDKDAGGEQERRETRGGGNADLQVIGEKKAQVLC